MRAAPCPLGRRKGHRWGTTRSEIAYHGGKVKIERPRVRDFAGREMSLTSWELLSEPELLRAWPTNLMVINVSTRKYGRAVRLPAEAGGDLPTASGDATSKSAVSRRFVALTRSKLKAWLASPLDDLDLVVLQIDGLHVGDHVMVAAIGIDGGGDKHVLGLAEGATENTATVQALLDNLIARGLDAERPRLYILDGAKALSKAIRRTFGRAALIQRCQVHKGRNIVERLDESLHAGVTKVLRQVWEQDDAAKAEKLLRNLARRLEHDAPGVSGSILEGLDEILTVIRLGLPLELRRSLACTNAIVSDGLEVRISAAFPCLGVVGRRQVACGTVAPLDTCVRLGGSGAVQSRGRSSAWIGSPARSRMSMSFQSSPSRAGRRRTTLLSFRISRAAASSPWRVAS